MQTGTHSKENDQKNLKPPNMTTIKGSGDI